MSNLAAIFRNSYSASGNAGNPVSVPDSSPAAVSNSATNIDNSAAAETTTDNMPRQNVMRSVSTNQGYSAGAKIYNMFAQKKNKPKYDDLKQPVTQEEHGEFKILIESFAKYCVDELRKANGDFYNPSCCSQYFSNFISSLMGEISFATYQKPQWMSGMWSSIKRQCTENARTRGKNEGKKIKTSKLQSVGIQQKT